MYKLRIMAQALVALFVLLSTGARLGFSTYPPASLFFVAAAATVWLVMQRTTWLPFLGPTVMPVGLLDVKTPRDSDFAIVLPAPKHAVKAVYWGSVIAADDPVEAYGGYTNGGIADVVDGKVKFALMKPKVYKVGGRALRRHVHYRWIGPKGMLSAVKTVYV